MRMLSSGDHNNHKKHPPQYAHQFCAHSNARRSASVTFTATGLTIFFICYQTYSAWYSVLEIGAFAFGCRASA